MKIYKIPFISGLGRTSGCEKSPDEFENLIKKKSFNFINVPVDNSNIEYSNKEIISKVRFEEKTIIVGGDHSVSYASAKAFFQKNKNSGMVVFDAHADLMPSMKEQTHEDWLRKLIDEKIVSSERIILVGLRNVEIEEEEFIRKNKIRALYMANLPDLSTLGDLIMEFSRNFEKIYISIDVDIIDPAFAPGVSCPEPAGFTNREFFALLRRIFLLKNINVVDIIEINPLKDINNITIKTGIKIIEEFSKEEEK